MTTLQVARDALTKFNITVASADSPINAGNPITQPKFFFGSIRNFKPPDFKQKNAPWPAMGDGQPKVDLGMEELQFTFTSARYSPALRAMYGKNIRFTLKAGLWQGATKKFLKYQIIASGDIEEVDSSQVSAGELPDGTMLMMNCHKYQEWGPGNSNVFTKFVDIDIHNFRRFIDGSDQLEELRAFFGISGTTGSSGSNLNSLPEVDPPGVNVGPGE